MFGIRHWLLHPSVHSSSFYPTPLALAEAHPPAPAVIKHTHVRKTLLAAHADPDAEDDARGRGRRHHTLLYPRPRRGPHGRL